MDDVQYGELAVPRAAAVDFVARCPTSHRHVHHAADGESYNAELKARLATLESQHGRIMRGPTLERSHRRAT